MFSTGQLIFAALFFISFVIIIVYTYKKDKALHQKYYKGAKWVGLLFLVFVLILFIIKHYIKN